MPHFELACIHISSFVCVGVCRNLLSRNYLLENLGFKVAVQRIVGILLLDSSLHLSESNQESEPPWFGRVPCALVRRSCSRFFFLVLTDVKRVLLNFSGFVRRAGGGGWAGALS